MAQIVFKKNFLDTSSAPCLSSILLAKKLGKNIRVCIDYWKLNALIKKDVYLILLIAKTLAQLNHAKMFIKIDIWKAFHKFCMFAESEDLITIITHFGVCKWKILSFGLIEKLALWQCFINKVLWEYLNQFCTAYLDNILIYSWNLQKHKEQIRKMLAKL